jgi:cell wall assembly regulator SMI1
MNDLINRLDKWHREHRPAFLGQLRPPVADDTLARMSGRVGAPLPAPFIALLRWHDGSKEDEYGGFQFNRQLMSGEGVLAAMDVMNELVDDGEFEQPYWWRKRWLPFLDNGGGDHVCIDFEGCFGGKPGQVIEFWHDDDTRTVAYPSVEAWLSCFVEALEAGMFADEDGDLHPTDDDAFEALVSERCPGYPMTFDAQGAALDDDADADA